MILLDWSWRNAFIRMHQTHLSRGSWSRDRIVTSMYKAQVSTPRSIHMKQGWPIPVLLALRRWRQKLTKSMSFSAITPKTIGFVFPISICYTQMEVADSLFVKIDKDNDLSLGCYCYDEIPWAKVGWRGKHLFGLYCHNHVRHQRKRRQKENQAGQKEVGADAESMAGWCLNGLLLRLWLLSLLSYRTQHHWWWHHAEWSEPSPITHSLRNSL